jgi:rhodanese-related sulfurtransferase
MRDQNANDSRPQEPAPSSPPSRRRVLRGVVGAGALLGGAAAAGGIWRWRLRPVAHDQPRLSPAEAHAAAQAGQITLVDIRSPEEWHQTGVAVGAVPIDMRRVDFVAALDQALAGDRAAPVALICARGVRSARMTLDLAAAGFPGVIDVPQGMLGSADGPGWIAAQLPVVPWQD